MYKPHLSKHFNHFGPGHRVGVQGHGVDALLHEPLGKVRMIWRTLATDAHIPRCFVELFWREWQWLEATWPNASYGLPPKNGSLSGVDLLQLTQRQRLRFEETLCESLADRGHNTIHMRNLNNKNNKNNNNHHHHPSLSSLSQDLILLSERTKSLALGLGCLDQGLQALHHRGVSLIEVLSHQTCDVLGFFLKVV